VNQTTRYLQSVSDQQGIEIGADCLAERRLAHLSLVHILSQTILSSAASVILSPQASRRGGAPDFVGTKDP